MKRARALRAGWIPLLALSLSGCLHHVPASVFARGDIRVDCCGHSDEPVEMTFLGTMGWLIQKGSVSILTGPLFSNPSLVRTGLGEIHPDTARIAKGLEDFSQEVARASAILVGHGHYDHAMDVPFVAMTRALGAKVFTNETAAIQMMSAGLPSDRIVAINDSLASSVEHLESWIRIPGAPRVRILPLLSDHGPHFAGYRLYVGVRHEKMSAPPRTAADWLDGEPIAFLIDFMNADDSTVAFRIYYQDAVPAPLYGFIPRVLRDHPPDVALLVPSTYGEVPWHPDRFMLEEKPRHVLLGHWEDFFKPPTPEPKPAITNDLAGFIWRLERSLPEGSGWHVPLPYTRFIFD